MPSCAADRKNSRRSTWRSISSRLSVGISGCSFWSRIGCPSLCEASPGRGGAGSRSAIGRRRFGSSLVLVGAVARPHVDTPPVLEVFPLEPLVRPEDDVLRHVGREAAGGRAATERFGEAPDVV